MKQLGPLLREFRRRAGLTQQEASELAGLSVASLRDLEQGRVLRPRARTLRRLVDALELTPAEAGQLMNAAKGDAEPRLRVDILGPLRVSVNGVLIDPGSERQRVLLGLLALTPNTPVSRDALIEAAWGARPPSGEVGLLQSRISRLRRYLPSSPSDADLSSVLTAGRNSYTLRVGEDQHDLLVFRRLVTRAREAAAGGDPAAACELFDEAVRLWRGNPLAGLPVLQSHPSVVEVTREWQAAVVEYAAVAAELGRYEQVLPLLRQVTEADPLHEIAHAELMIALAGSGQQAAALTVFDALRRRLADELGVDPGPELAGAYQRVLRQEVTRPVAAPVTAHRQLPPDIAHFTGREAALRTICDWLTARRGGRMVIMSIEGMAGAGKTRLAVHLAHRLLVAGRHADVQLYVDLHAHSEQPPADPGAVLASFLRLLGVPGSELPAGIEEREALYRDRLAGRKALVLLDNAADEAQIRPLLPAGPDNLVLITSRRTLALDEAHTLPLDVFTPAEAEELLVRVVGEHRVRADPAATRRVVEACARLPLAVALVARRLQSRQVWTMADVADRLADTGDRLGELSVGRRQLRAVFDMSYQALAPSERRLFRLLGLHPGEDFSPLPAAALAGVTPAEARRLLDRLVDEHLVTVVTGDRYRLHDLLREYARQVVVQEESPEARRTASTRLLDYYLHAVVRAACLLMPHRLAVPLVGEPPAHAPRLESRSDAADWLEANRAGVIAATVHAAEHGWPEHGWRLASAVWGFLFLNGYLQDWVRVHEAAAAGTEPGSLGEAIVRGDLGGAYTVLGRNEVALVELVRSVELFRRIPERTEDVIVRESLALGALGLVCYRLDRIPEALHYMRKSAATCAERHPHSDAGDQAGDETVLAALVRLEHAIASHMDGITGSRQAGDPDLQSKALADLGNACRVLGVHETGLDYTDHAVVIAVAHGLRGREAYARHRLGNAFLAMQRFDEARAEFEAALRIIRENGGSQVSESEVLRDLGRLRLEVAHLVAAT